MKCCICGQIIKYPGNNPWPVVKDSRSRCCDKCNLEIVIPARIELFNKESGDEQ